MTASSGGTFSVYIDGNRVLNTACTPPGAGPYAAACSGTNEPAAVTTFAGAALTPTALTAGQVALHASLALHGFVQQQSGQRIAAVLSTLGIPAAMQSIATGISPVQAPTAALTTTPALSHIQTVETTEQGFFYVDESGVFTYRDRHYVIQNAAAITSNGTFANDTNNAHTKFLAGLDRPRRGCLGPVERRPRLSDR